MRPGNRSGMDKARRPSRRGLSVSRLSMHHLFNMSLKWGNFLCSDPSNADAIVCYLMPGVMAKLGNFLDKATRPGTFVVTNTFLFREHRASAVRRRGLRGTVALYIRPGRHWTVKGRRRHRPGLRCMFKGDENTGIFSHCATSTF